MPNVHKKFVNGNLASYTINGVPQPISSLGETVVIAATTAWPIWAKGLKLLSAPQDKGVGDTVARLIGNEKSEAFKSWYKQIFGRSCGCNGRQAGWNRSFPYS